MSNALKPCPFCGCTDIRATRRGEVMCMAGDCDAVQDSVEAWNRRAPDARIADAKRDGPRCDAEFPEGGACNAEMIEGPNGLGLCCPACLSRGRIAELCAELAALRASASDVGADAEHLALEACSRWMQHEYDALDDRLYKIGLGYPERAFVRGYLVAMSRCAAKDAEIARQRAAKGAAIARVAPMFVEPVCLLALKDIEQGLDHASDGIQVHHGDLLDFLNKRLAAALTARGLRVEGEVRP